MYENQGSEMSTWHFPQSGAIVLTAAIVSSEYFLWKSPPSQEAMNPAAKCLLKVLLSGSLGHPGTLLIVPSIPIKLTQIL